MKAVDKDWMEEQFVEEGKTIGEVAAECGEPRFRIAKWKNIHDFGEEVEEELVECEYCGDEFKDVEAHLNLSDCGE